VDDDFVTVVGDPGDSTPRLLDPGIEVRVLGPVDVVGWKTRPERAVALAE
jgi:hypothetical protein